MRGPGGSWIVAGALVLATATTIVEPVGAQECPVVKLHSACFNVWRGDVSYSLACTTATGGVSEASFNRRSGQLYWRDAIMSLEDDFVVECLPAGTPVTLTLRVAGSGRVTAPASFAFEFWMNDVPVGILMDATRYNPELPPYEWEHTATAQLDVVAGVPFRLLGWGGLGGPTGPGSGTVWFWADYDFINLPPGACITSCGGYGTTPTPASHSTWGRLKTIYR